MKQFFDKRIGKKRLLPLLLAVCVCCTLGATFAKYITTEPVGAFNLTVEGGTPVMFAVYGDYTSNDTTVKALNFYNRVMPKVGDTLKLDDGTQKVETIFTSFEPSSSMYNPSPFDAVKYEVKSVKVIDKIAPSTTAHWFDYLKYTNDYDVLKLDTSNVTAMQYMFGTQNDGILATFLDLSAFDTRNVTNMTGMFQQAYSLETIIVSDTWTVDNVTSSSQMFASCPKLVGGSGTTVTSQNYDKTYARIDGMNGQPGYLTGIVHPRIDETSLPGVVWNFDDVGNFNVGEDSTIVLSSDSGTLPAWVTLTSSTDDSEPVAVDADGVIEIPANMMKKYSTLTISAVENLKSFTVTDENDDVHTYYFEDGMIWRQWLKSNYNTPPNRFGTESHSDYVKFDEQYYIAEEGRGEGVDRVTDSIKNVDYNAVSSAPGMEAASYIAKGTFVNQQIYEELILLYADESSETYLELMVQYESAAESQMNAMNDSDPNAYYGSIDGSSFTDYLSVEYDVDVDSITPDLYPIILTGFDEKLMDDDCVVEIGSAESPMQVEQGQNVLIRISPCGDTGDSYWLLDGVGTEDGAIQVTFTSASLAALAGKGGIIDLIYLPVSPE